MIDLLDAFEGIDVDSIRVLWFDPHPDAAGHRSLADELYGKLRKQPEAWTALTGEAVNSQRTQTAALSH